MNDNRTPASTAADRCAFKYEVTGRCNMTRDEHREMESVTEGIHQMSHRFTPENNSTEPDTSVSQRAPANAAEGYPMDEILPADLLELIREESRKLGRKLKPTEAAYLIGEYEAQRERKPHDSESPAPLCDWCHKPIEDDAAIEYERKLNHASCWFGDNEGMKVVVLSRAQAFEAAQQRIHPTHHRRAGLYGCIYCANCGATTGDVDAKDIEKPCPFALQAEGSGCGSCGEGRLVMIPTCNVCGDRRLNAEQAEAMSPRPYVRCRTHDVAIDLGCSECADAQRINQESTSLSDRGSAQ